MFLWNVCEQVQDHSSGDYTRHFRRRENPRCYWTQNVSIVDLVRQSTVEADCTTNIVLRHLYIPFVLISTLLGVFSIKLFSFL